MRRASSRQGRNTWGWLAVPLLLLAPGALASSPAVPSTAGVTSQISQLLLGLGVVIGLIFLLAWVVRRLQGQVGPRSNQVIKLLSSQALGQRERLLLVQVGEEQILLGLTAGRITPLHVLQQPVVLPETENATPEFAKRLQELLKRDAKP
ncbi:flagellar biosynthetic protein FliO [Pseudomonas sp. B392_1p]|uniref:flagellar biosynthetic protein FliO n=1 Tax=Pseudomonas sp. B392_1p TaxID=3457507 RepID=UPI003FCF191E